MKIKKIFSLDKAIQLETMGNKILFNEKNKKFPQYRVFCFIETEKLIEDWKTICK